MGNLERTFRSASFSRRAQVSASSAGLSQTRCGSPSETRRSRAKNSNPDLQPVPHRMASVGTFLPLFKCTEFSWISRISSS
jgi:hypothetical protein